MFRFLHLSDIHFETPYCLNSQLDRDGPIRDALIDDLQRFVAADQIPISAILVTGDIAYKADPEEYKIASEWLDDLCDKLNCPPQSVFVVPGNHDVNRSTGRDYVVSAVRDQVLAMSGEARERHFQKVLADPDSGPFLIRPMAAYNRFAARYGCEISAERPFWTEEVPIAGGAYLVLTGLTSTFFSGDNDLPGRLFLGGIQTNFRKKEGAIHLAMMHHPPDWFQESDAIDDALSNGAAIQLLGHKHRGRWTPGDESIRISGDAFHPDKSESEYEPGYNIIDLDLKTDGNGESYISVRGHIRVLQTSPYIFRGKVNRRGEDNFEQKIPITIPITKESDALQQSSATKANNPETPAEELRMPVEKPQISMREAVYKFWNLKSSQRMSIITELDLVSAEDLELPETERYHRAFVAAEAGNLVEELIDKIASMENE